MNMLGLSIGFALNFFFNTLSAIGGSFMLKAEGSDHHLTFLLPAFFCLLVRFCFKQHREHFSVTILFNQKSK